MLIRVVKKGNRDMCAVSGLPANTEEWKRFDRIFEENVLELGFDEQKNEIYLVYMMTDAIESILVLEHAVMTGDFDRQYEGECSGSITTLEDGNYMLAVRQGQDNAFTVRFQAIHCEETLYDYHKIGHFWMKDYEILRHLTYQIGLIYEKAVFMGESYCNRKERALLPLYDLAPLRKYICVYWEENESFSSTTEAVDTAIHNASVIRDKSLVHLFKKYRLFVDKDRQNSIVCGYYERKIMKALAQAKHWKFIKQLFVLIQDAAKDYEQPFFGSQKEQWIEKSRKVLQEKYPERWILEEHSFCIGEPFSYRFHVCRLQKKRGKIVLDRIEYKIDQDGMLRQI